MKAKLNELRLDAGIARIENQQWLCVLNKETGMMIDPLIGLEKFAELIVKECTNYMNSRTKDWDAKLRWIFNDGSGYMEVDVDSLLKEHFGVEE